MNKELPFGYNHWTMVTKLTGSFLMFTQLNQLIFQTKSMVLYNLSKESLIIYALGNLNFIMKEVKSIR